MSRFSTWWTFVRPQWILAIPSTRCAAVDGESYSADGLKEAIRLAQGKTTPIRLLVKDKDQFRTVRIDYHQGLRYPKLERIPETPALLDAILAPRK